MQQLIEQNSNLMSYPVKRGSDRIQKLIEFIGNRGYIAGSYAAHMASTGLVIEPADIDIFAVSDRDADAMETDLVRHGMFPEQSNSIVTTLAPNEYTDNPICDMNIQIIKPNPTWKNFPDDIIHSFDLNICKAILIGDEVIADIEIGSTVGRVLRVANPVRTMRRIMKYQARGVQFDDWEIVKIFLAWGELSDDRVREITEAAQPEEDNYDEPYEWYDADDYFDAE